jgi:hypothetical protein
MAFVRRWKFFSFTQNVSLAMVQKGCKYLIFNVELEQYLQRRMAHLSLIFDSLIFCFKKVATVYRSAGAEYGRYASQLERAEVVAKLSVAILYQLSFF